MSDVAHLKRPCPDKICSERQAVTITDVFLFAFVFKFLLVLVFVFVFVFVVICFEREAETI